jgi:hypothetical protein
MPRNDFAGRGNPAFHTEPQYVHEPPLTYVIDMSQVMDIDNMSVIALACQRIHEVKRLTSKRALQRQKKSTRIHIPRSSHHKNPYLLNQHGERT